MQRLIRSQKSGAVDYFEVWTADDGVVVHTGTLGRPGSVRQVPTVTAAETKKVIAQELRAARKRGFDEIDPAQIKDLVTQLAMSPRPPVKQLEHRRLLEGLVTEVLSWRPSAAASAATSAAEG